MVWTSTRALTNKPTHYLCRDPLRPLRHVSWSGAELQHRPVVVRPHRPVRHRGEGRDVTERPAEEGRQRGRGGAPPVGRFQTAV